MNSFDVLIHTLIFVLSILLAPYLTSLFERLFPGARTPADTSPPPATDGVASKTQQERGWSERRTGLSPQEYVEKLRRERQYRVDFRNSLGPALDDADDDPPPGARISSGPANGIWHMDHLMDCTRDYPTTRDELVELRRRCEGAPQRLKLRRRDDQHERGSYMDDDPIPSELRDWIVDEFKRMIQIVSDLRWRKESDVPLGKCHADNVCTVHRWNAVAEASRQKRSTSTIGEEEEWESVDHTSADKRKDEWEMVGYDSDNIGRVQCWLRTPEEFLDAHPAFRDAHSEGDVCLIEVQDSVLLYGSASSLAFLEMNRVSFDAHGDWTGWPSGTIRATMDPGEIIRSIAKNALVMSDGDNVVSSRGLTDHQPSGLWITY